MKIEFSRHARRRMKLYDIDEADVAQSIKNHFSSGTSGKREIIDESLVEKYYYPLKTVYFADDVQITVITTYPLKGKRKP